MWMAEATADAAYKPPPLDESKLHAGQVVPCTILEKLESGAYAVDIGIQRPALLPRSEVRLRPNITLGRRDLGRGWGLLEPGEVFEAQVLPSSDGRGMDTAESVNVSLARVQRRVAWQRIVQLAEEDLTIEATILRFSEQGATLDIEGLPAFMPWSHWQLPQERRTSELYGLPIAVKFLDVDVSRVRLVVSHRRFRLEQAMNMLQAGDLVEGIVSQVRDYGATVKLAGGLVEGLLHVSQVSELYVKNMSAIFTPGDSIMCVVLQVDSKDGSISLSTKRLEATPGEVIEGAAAMFERTRRKQAGVEADDDEAAMDNDVDEEAAETA